MLNNRNSLLNKARDLVHDRGYSYAKGKSRAKRFLDTSGESTIPVKRTKHNEEFRRSRMDEISERITDISDQIKFKEKRREQSSNSHNYKSCDMLTEQMSQLKTERRELECELSLLQKKHRRATNMKTKRRASVVRSPESFFTPISRSPTPGSSNYNVSVDSRSGRSSTPYTSDHDTVILSSDSEDPSLSSPRSYTESKKLLSPRSSQEPGSLVSPRSSQEPGSLVSPRSSQEPGSLVSPKSCKEPGSLVSPKSSKELGSLVSPRSSQEPGSLVSPRLSQEPGSSVTPQEQESLVPPSAPNTDF